MESQQVRNIGLVTNFSQSTEDDKTLLAQWKTLAAANDQKAKEFQRSLSLHCEDDYVSVVISRLAYAFTKEKYDICMGELKKRGLLIG